jgi:hypothetical protein
VSVDGDLDGVLDDSEPQRVRDLHIVPVVSTAPVNKVPKKLHII